MGDLGLNAMSSRSTGKKEDQEKLEGTLKRPLSQASIFYRWLNSVHMLGASLKRSAENPADQLNKTCSFLCSLDCGNREDTDLNALDRVNRGMSDGIFNRGRGHWRELRRAQSLSSGIDNQGTNRRENETEKTKFEPKNLHSEPTSIDGVLNFTQAMSGEEVQKAEMGKSKALVTMTDDGKGKSFTK